MSLFRYFNGMVQQLLLILLIGGGAGCAKTPNIRAAQHCDTVSVGQTNQDGTLGPVSEGKPASGPKTAAKPKPNVVSFEMFIMSKCPYSNKSLQNLVPVVLSLAEHVEFSLNYVANVDDGELESMHGDSEIKGNILQLCAHQHGSTEQWLKFIDCQSKEWHSIPENWEECAAGAGYDQSTMVTCYTGGNGEKLLRDSIAKTEAEGFTGSPIFLINREKYDGGRSENEFGWVLCRAFGDDPPPFCQTMPQPLRFNIIIISDKRCTGRGCDAQWFESFVRNRFLGATIEKLDFAESRARELYESSQLQYLPIAVIGSGVKEDVYGFDRIEKRLVEMEGGQNYAFPIGRVWDPIPEICDDGIDNNKDGKVDCDDKRCEPKMNCRQ